MRAVLADLSTPRYLWTAAAGKDQAGCGLGSGRFDASHGYAGAAVAT